MVFWFGIYLGCGHVLISLGADCIYRVCLDGVRSTFVYSSCYPFVFMNEKFSRGIYFIQIFEDIRHQLMFGSFRMANFIKENIYKK